MIANRTDSKKSKDVSVFFDDDVFGMANIFISTLNLAVSLSSRASMASLQQNCHDMQQNIGPSWRK